MEGHVAGLDLARLDLRRADLALCMELEHRFHSQWSVKFSVVLLQAGAPHALAVLAGPVDLKAPGDGVRGLAHREPERAGDSGRGGQRAEVVARVAGQLSPFAMYVSLKSR